MKKLMKIAQDNRGFTLVELIIATVILSVIMAPLMRSFIMASSMSQNAKNYGAATVSVENAVESIKNASAGSFKTDLEARYGTDSVTFTPDPAAQTVTGTYEFKDETDEIEVVIREPDSSDDLALLNTQNLSAYTNMDLTLIQTSGSYILGVGDLGYDSSVGTQYVLNDIDVLGINNVVAEAAGRGVVLGTAEKKQIKRNILIDLSATTQLVTEEVVADDGTVSTTTTSVPALKYTVWYEYSYNSYGDRQKAFTGSVSAGSDDVVAMQFVYVPLNQQTSVCNETIEINYSSYLPEHLSLRLFLIKQVRTTHAISCGSFNADMVPASDFSCNTCASASYDDGWYYCDVTLVVPDGDADIDLYSNIHYNIYSDTYLPVSRFNFTQRVGTSAGVTSSLADKLVVSVQGGRVYIVDITSTAANGDVSTMQTLKLN